MKFLTALMFTATLTTPVYAQGSTGYDFYSNQVDNWYVGGYSGDTGDVNPACYIEYTFRDSSVFQLIKDLEDGELYIWLQNTAWNIFDTPGIYHVTANLRYKNGDIGPASGRYQYNLINKNTITIRSLNVEEFIPDLMKAIQIELIMDGSIDNAYIPLESSYRAIEEMASCIQVSDEVKLNF